MRYQMSLRASRLQRGATMRRRAARSRTPRCRCEQQGGDPSGATDRAKRDRHHHRDTVAHRAQAHFASPPRPAGEGLQQ